MRFSASLTFMFRELPLLDRFTEARASGFTGVEIQRIAEGNVEEMARAVRDAGVAVALINVSSGDYLTGGDGLSGVPGREEEFRLNFEFALDAARVMGAEHLHLGPSRVPAGVSRAECLRTYKSNVRSALAISRAVGTPLLIEPMNRKDAPTALIGSLDNAVDVLTEFSSPRLGLQFDIYHTAMNGDDSAAMYERHRWLVRHVQFSDAPGRHEPGSGTLPIPAILRGIERTGYAGWFGAEYLPTRDTQSSLKWMSELSAGIPS